MRPLLTVNCVLFLDLQCIQRSRLTSAGNKISGVLSVDTPQKMFKLYHEVPTEKAGQRSAPPNVGLQVGLQESTTGIAKGRVIIASLNVPPPYRSSMQRTANKVGNATATMTLADLAKKRDHMKTINTLRGLPEDAPVTISMDSRYSSARITGSYHTGQNASQAIGVVVEQQSRCQDIVALHIQNKLCSH